jgi:hypothetical protein
MNNKHNLPTSVVNRGAVGICEIISVQFKIIQICVSRHFYTYLTINGYLFITAISFAK